jgi:hypothetical protein
MNHQEDLHRKETLKFVFYGLLVFVLRKIHQMILNDLAIKFDVDIKTITREKSRLKG